MKKRAVSGLIYFMAIVIVGLIALQYSFIRISYEEKQEIYNQHIYQALQNTTERLKSRQSVMYIYERLNASPQDSIKPVDPTMFSLNYADGSRLNIEFQMRNQGPDYPQSRNQVIPGSNVNINNIEQFFDEIMVKQQSDLYQILSKMEHEINLRKQPLSRIYTNHSIQSILSEELKNQGIYQPFDYAIVQNKNIHPSLRSANFSKSDLDDAYKINLQPRAIFNYPELLYIKLPKRKAFLMDSLSMQISLSIIFVLIILITFFISTYIILRQKRLNEMKTDFISNMTHEFKTPIATIRLAGDSLKNDKILSNQKMREQFIGIISQETSRLNNQVEKVLEISSLDRGEMKLKLQNHDIHAMIEEVVKTFDLSLKQRKGKIMTALNAEHTQYLIDKEHMMNVVSNLIDNAIKYSESEPDMTITTYNKNKWIYIAVKDHGIGMDQATLTKVFEKFYRASNINIHNVKGFGLGLHYVK
ncbi:MAG: ATP-binding protein, partial [Bacteroidales bacterium]|nr:ATP-binding protein [Bacteroidales bacterium]